MRILLPNEHGAWGIFFTAFLLGWLGAPVLSWHPLWLLPAALGAFLARYPLGLYFKKRRVTRALKIPLTREKYWFAIYASFTAVTAAPLFYFFGWWWLLIFAGISGVVLGIHLRSLITRQERSFFVEWTAMFGMASLAPAASFAAAPVMGWNPITVWLMLVAFYTWRIRVVRRLVAARTTLPVDIRRVGTRELNMSICFLIASIIVLRIFYSGLF